MSLVGQATMAFLLGLLLLIAAPIVLGRLGLNGVPRTYFSWATTLGGAGLLINHSKGLVLRWASYDEEVGKWEVRLDGDVKHFADPANRMGRLLGVPFGVCDENLGIVIAPPDAALMEVLSGRFRRGDLIETTTGLAGGENAEQAVADGGHRVVTEEWADALVQPFEERAGDGDTPPRVVDLAPGRWVGMGSEPPDSTAYIRNLQEIATEFFNSTSKWDVVKWIMPLLATFGMMWLGAQVRSGDTPTPSNSGGTVNMILPPGLVQFDASVVVDLVAMGVA